jgi:hypothetical protein
MQSIIIYIAFGAAVVYIGWKVFSALRHKDTGCAHCSASELNTSQANKKNLPGK